MTRKADVSTREGRPAINVKVYTFPRHSPKGTQDLPQRALEMAWDTAQESFWHHLAPHHAQECFGAGVEVYAGGRSGGWLVADGLPPIESWDAIQLAKWTRFASAIHAEIAYLTSAEWVRETIDATGWVEPVALGDN